MSLSADYTQPQAFNFGGVDNDDLSYLLPIVTPILDEYDDDGEAEAEEAAAAAAEAADHSPLLGMECGPPKEHQRCEEEEEDRQDTSVVQEEEEDDDGSVTSDMTDYSAVSAELQYYHNVVAKRAMSINSEDEDDEVEDDMPDMDETSHDGSSVELDESLLVRRTVPQLPRPRLWTLSERGESTATKNSEKLYKGGLNGLRRATALHSPRSVDLHSPRSMEISIDIEDIAEDVRNRRSCGVWLSEVGGKVLATVFYSSAKSFKKIKHQSSSEKCVSFHSEDPTVTSGGTEDFSYHLRRDSQVSQVNSTCGLVTVKTPSGRRRNSPFRRRRASF